MVFNHVLYGFLCLIHQVPLGRAFLGKLPLYRSTMPRDRDPLVERGRTDSISRVDFIDV